MCPADHRCLGVRLCQPGEFVPNPSEVSFDDLVALPDQEDHRCVGDILAGRSPVDVLARLADGLLPGLDYRDGEEVDLRDPFFEHREVEVLD